MPQIILQKFKSGASKTPNNTHLFCLRVELHVDDFVTAISISLIGSLFTALLQVLCITYPKNIVLRRVSTERFPINNVICGSFVVEIHRWLHSERTTSTSCNSHKIQFIKLFKQVVIPVFNIFLTYTALVRRLKSSRRFTDC